MQYEFTVNLHVTERCNFSCSYCFGKWHIAATSGLFEDIPLARELIRDVAGIFSPTDSEPIRFNFVGGEPALLRSLPELVSFCKAIGAKTSFVTNGLMLQRFSPSWLAANFDIVGLSIDSLSQVHNRVIGRSTRSGSTPDLDMISDGVFELKSLGVTVKVNTVVSAVNCEEDFSDLIRKLRPDKWKIFQMLPVYDGRFMVSAAEFNDFIARHEAFKEVIFAEDNDEMTGSYVMIDPLGRFFWYEGEPCLGYKYSRPILEVGAAEAFSESVILWSKYANRGKKLYSYITGRWITRGPRVPRAATSRPHLELRRYEDHRVLRVASRSGVTHHDEPGAAAPLSQLETFGSRLRAWARSRSEGR